MMALTALDRRISEHFGAREAGSTDQEPAGDIPTSNGAGLHEKVNRP